MQALEMNNDFGKKVGVQRILNTELPKIQLSWMEECRRVSVQAGGHVI